MTDNVTATSGAGASPGSSDPVNHPTHYAEGWSRGAEVIDITENLNFNRGNAVKYIARAGRKSALLEVEDLQKAQWYLSREIERLTDRSQAEPAYSVVAQEFWDDIDASILEAQEKRERETTSKPPRVWDSITEVPVGVQVRDAEGDGWTHVLGRWYWGNTFTGRMPAEYPLDEYDESGPFTEVLS